MNGIVTVAVKSAWASKVNWIAALTALSALITQFTPLLPPADQGEATAAVTVIGTLLTIVTKTFFTTTVTPSSAAKV